MRTALDTNIISTLWSQQPAAQLVAAVLNQARREGGLVICGAVYAELAAHPGKNAGFLENFLATVNISVDFVFG